MEIDFGLLKDEHEVAIAKRKNGHFGKFMSWISK